MIGHSLRKTPGVAGQMRWTFVRAPLDWSPEIVLAWDGERNRGVIFCSQRVFNRIEESKLLRRTVEEMCAHVELGRASTLKAEYLLGNHTRPLTDRDVLDFENFLFRAEPHPVMMHAAFVMVSLMNRHHKYDDHARQIGDLFRATVDNDVAV